MKKIVLFLLFVTVWANLFSQQANIILNTPHNGHISYDYVARDEIKMEPVFSYKPVTGQLLVARIDENIVLPVDYALSPIDVNSRELDYSLPVGTITGSYSVNISGASTYQIPLVIPPGTAGMQPSVSLVYNSQAGNGLLGYGWNIAGLSAITRVGHTIYHDGDIKGVDFNDDRFSIDGNRLILISGNYGGDDSKYYTEIFNGSRITAKGSAGEGPQYFIVETKDGKTIEYGRTYDSRFVAEGKTDVLVWKINRIIDKIGNYIDFVYDNSPEHTYNRIKKIIYTGNVEQNLEPYCEIHFYYSERSDKHLGYVAGSKIEANVLLDHIKIFSDNDLVRKYEFIYYYDFYSHLIEVKEYNSNGERYNSTVFEWNNNNRVFSYGQSFNQSSYEYFSGDFNGDGVSDIFAVHFYYDQSWTKYYNYYKIYKSGGPNNVVDEGDLSSIRNIIIGDYNGDGLSDVILTFRDQEESYDNWYYFKWITESEGFSFDKNSQYFAIVTEVPEDEYPFKSYRSADFNGDMQSDVIFNLMTDYSTSWVVHIMTDNFNTYINKTSTNDNEFIKIADFNGNGKDDIMAILEGYSTSCILYEYDNINNTFNSFYSDGYPTKDHSIYTGDFNGDGKDDIVTWCELAGWELSYFGNGWKQIPVEWPGDKDIDPSASILDNNYHIADFNSDGKADIFEYYVNWNGSGASTSTFNIFYFNGNTFEKYNINNINMVNIVIGKDLFGDFNGDGNLDIITGEYQTPEYRIIKFNTNSPISNIIDIADGFNAITHFNYAPITNIISSPLSGKDIYTKYDNAFNDFDGNVQDMQNTLYVTYYSQTDNGIGNVSETYYFYEGARIHRFGKGFLGFQKIIYDKKISGIRGISIEKVFDNNSSNFYIEPLYTFKKIRTSSPPPGGLSYQTIYEEIYSTHYKTNYPDDLILLPYNYQTTSKDYLTEIKTVLTNDNVDNYGNILSSTLIYSNLDGTETEGSVQTIAAYTDEGSWCANLPDYVTVIKSRTDETDDFSQSTDYTYNPNGLLTEKVDFADLPQPVTTDFSYDDFGNVTTISLSASDIVPRTTNTAFDTKGRFVISKTDQLNNTSHFLFDSKTGQLLISKDITGLVTKYLYDDFGRRTKVVYPDGNETKYSLHWNSDNTKENILYYSKIVSDGAPQTVTYFDLLGRERISSIENPDGSFSETETVYNANGQVYSVSEPYLSGNVPQYNTYYTYKDDGRIKKIEHPNGETTTYTYNGRTVNTVYSGTGVENIKTFDAFGLTVSETDPSGTIDYTYFSSGLPKTITTPNTPGNTTDVVFEMHYNAYGRQDWLDDPNAGKTEYNYNAMGELIWQKDANGNEFNISYDDVGRIANKTASDGSVITYSYITEGNGLEQLSSVVLSNGISYSFSYDKFGRTVSETEIVDGHSFKTQYTYDSNGNIKSLEYPSGFKILYTFAKGYPLQVVRADNEDILYENPQYNVRGQLTDYDLGNGLHTHKGFNEFGLPNGISTGQIQNLQYEFDNGTGNLNWRKDIIFSIQEIFSYDDALKNRLTEWSVGTQTNNAMYYGNGNIISKSDVGNYKYEYNTVGGTGGPHSVTSITDPVNIPAETNQTIFYNVFNKVYHINNLISGYDYYLTYGPDQARKKSETKQNGNLLKTKYYIGGYEKEIDNEGNVKETHYIQGGDGLLAVYITENGTGTLYYVQKDHLGSVYCLTDENGNIATHNGQQQIFSFDPWGRRRNPSDWTFNTVPNADDYLIDRGFTGHQHLDLFGLVNMNGRMYDPLLGRMLSPDNYVQASGSSQGFNRYSYVMNNPLVYTDPSGEYVEIMYLAGVILTNYATNLIYGTNDPLGNAYNDGTAFVNEFANCAQFPIYQDENTTITAGIDPFAVGVSVNAYHTEGDFTFGASAGVGMAQNAYVNGNITYTSGDFTFGVGGGLASGNDPQVGGGITYTGDNWSLGYSYSYFGGDQSQGTGTFSGSIGDFSMRIENDLFAWNGQDRWRTSAIEIGIGDFAIGTNVLTNDPGNTEEKKVDPNGLNLRGKKNKHGYGAWVDGLVFDSPLYVSHRYGNKVSRIGFSHPMIQDRTQNFIHKNFGIGNFSIGYQNFYNKYTYSGGIYKYSGIYSPYTLW